MIFVFDFVFEFIFRGFLFRRAELCLALLAFLLSPVTIAASPRAAKKPLWEVGGGIGAAQLPHYPGSEQYHNFVLPFPYVIYRGERIRVGRQERKAILYQGTEHFWDISLGGSLPVDSNDNDARKGMKSLPPSLEIGPRWSYRLSSSKRLRSFVRLPVRKAFALDLEDFHDIGNILELNLNIDIFWDQAQSWQSHISTGIMGADRNYFDFFYRVRKEEARPERPAWRSHAGYGGVDFSFSLSKKIDRIVIFSSVYLHYIENAVFEESPLVHTKLNWAGAFAIRCVFYVSKKQVSISP